MPDEVLQLSRKRTNKTWNMQSKGKTRWLTPTELSVVQVRAVAVMRQATELTDGYVWTVTAQQIGCSTTNFGRRFLVVEAADGIDSRL